MKTDIYDFLGLKGSPFSPATSSHGYFETEQSAQILQEFCFGIASRKGFLLLLGEVGVGKTSLLLQLLGRLQDVKGLTSAWVFNTSMQRSDLLSAIIADFGLPAAKEASLAEMIDTLHAHFLEVNESGGNCTIVIDEAHNLSVQALEALRMLSNLEAGGQKLVQIILAGQPELDATLSRPDLRQLRSRISIHRILGPLSRQEVEEYCAFKLSQAERRIELPARSLRLLWSATRGNLRLIHLAMDRVMHGLIAHGSRRITPGILGQALDELAAFHERIRKRRACRRRWRIGLGLAGCFLCLGLLGFLSGFGRSSNAGVGFCRDLAGYLPFVSAQVQKIEQTAPLRPLAQEPQENKAGSLEGSQTASGKRYAIRETSRAWLDEVRAARLGAGSGPAGGRDAVLTSFLRAFGMDQLLPQLQKAVRQNDVSIFEKHLPKEFQVVASETLPESENVACACLPWKKLTGMGPGWLVLWRPPFHIRTERPEDSERMDILVLQRMLKELGYYASSLDGLYGAKTHQAVEEFRREAGLDGSPVVDARTAFELSLVYANPERQADEQDN